jgi:hypothetical protein
VKAGEKMHRDDDDDDYVWDGDDTSTEVVDVHLRNEEITGAVGAPKGALVEVVRRTLSIEPDVRVVITVTRDQLRRAAGAPAGSRVYLEPARPDEGFLGTVRVRYRRWRDNPR